MNIKLPTINLPARKTVVTLLVKATALVVTTYLVILGVSVYFDNWKWTPQSMVNLSFNWPFKIERRTAIISPLATSPEVVEAKVESPKVIAPK
jgi:hypothetical protein